MSENEQTANTEQQGEQQFVIQKIYVKDVSLEVPGAPQIFTDKWEPTVNLDLNSQAKKIDNEGVHEVVMTLTVTVKLAEKTAYLIEIKQAGVFTLKGFAKDNLQGMLGSYCPTILFPYAREAISDLVTKAGFPQLVLAPVNFDALYAKHVEQQKQQTTVAEATH